MISLFVSQQALNCLNTAGSSVDWYVQIKGNSGFKSWYLDTKARSAFKAIADINLDSSPVTRTVSQLYGEDYMVTMFNDDTPAGAANSKFAHQKGVLAFDKASNTGFYLMHSTPKWPPALSDSYSYTNTLYGQHFLCINIDKSQLEKMGRLLYISRPQLYQNSFDMAFIESSAPTLHKALSAKYETQATQTKDSITTRGGQKFDLFIKNKQAGIDIWADLIATSKKSDLYVETWLRDSEAVPSCDTYSVEMVGLVNFLGTQWKETQDHSKWGVSTEGKFACFSDINFMRSQAERGGGALCLDDASLGAAMGSLIVSLDPEMIC